MKIVRCVLAAYALLTAAAVGANFVATPLYDDGSTGFPVWSVLNWFMAVAVLLALGASAIWKIGLYGADADRVPPQRRLETNVLFYASVVLGLWFFWNWFGDLMSREVPLLWAFIDPLLVVTVGAVGLRLWRAPGDAG